jgi:phosphoglycerate dehydrogenase-like enzyme
MADPLIWLPFAATWLAPDGVRCEVVDVNTRLPEPRDDVEFVVLPYGPTDAALAGLSRLPRLKVVQSLAAGVDRVLPYVPKGVTLCSGRGAHDSATAELAVTLALAATRGIPEFSAAQSIRQWQPQVMPGLADQRVLVIGHGSIGSAIATRLRSFEADVVPVARRRRPGVHTMADIPVLLPDVDVVILSVPLTDETNGLVDTEFIARMRPGALLVSVARGAVVVTDDLVEALHAGRIKAALDVTDPEPLPAGHPLWGAPNLILTPHVGAQSKAMPARVQHLISEQVHRFATGRPLANQVDS